MLYEKIINTEFIICIPRRWLNKLFIWVVVVLADINITVAILFIDLVLEIWFSCKNGNVYRPCYILFSLFYARIGQILYMHSSDNLENAGQTS